LKKILIAESRKMVREYIKLILRLSGFKHVYFSGKSQSCLKKIKRIRPDLLVISSEVRGKCTFSEILEHIRNIKQEHPFHVLILADQSKNEFKNADTGGIITRIIPANFQPLELFRNVNRLIGPSIRADRSSEELTIGFEQRRFLPLSY